MKGRIMAIGRETTNFITKNLSQSNIRNILREPLRKATINPIEYDALAERDDIGINADEKAIFRTFGAVQITVNADVEENANIISLTAIWYGMKEIFISSYTKDNYYSKRSSLKTRSERQIRNFAKSRFEGQD